MRVCRSAYLKWRAIVLDSDVLVILVFYSRKYFEFSTSCKENFCILRNWVQNTVTGLDKAISHIKLKFLLGNMACQWVDRALGGRGGAEAPKSEVWAGVSVKSGMTQIRTGKMGTLGLLSSTHSLENLVTPRRHRSRNWCRR